MKSKTNKKKEQEGTRRRLLGYEDDWSEFTTYVETTQGTCNSKLLNHVSIYDDGTFNFQCSLLEHDKLFFISVILIYYNPQSPPS